MKNNPLVSILIINYNGEKFIKRCLNEPPSTLESLSKIYKVSRERIRQIEVRSFEKVKKIALETAINESKDLIEEKRSSLAT